MDELYIKDMEDIKLRISPTDSEVIEYTDIDDDDWEYPDEVVRTGYYNDLILLGLSDEMIFIATEKDLQEHYPEILKLIK